MILSFSLSTARGEWNKLLFLTPGGGGTSDARQTEESY